MNSSFLDVLNNLKGADKQTVVAKVFDLFLKISTMGKEELIAAHQTFWFFYENMKNPSDADEELLQKVDKAIGDRMLTLCCEPQDRGERARLVELFGNVLGGGIHYSALSHAIDGFQSRKK